MYVLGNYGVVLDAGSSVSHNIIICGLTAAHRHPQQGTRLYVYRWLNISHAREIANARQLRSLPSIETRKNWTKKTKPGISTFAERPDQVGPDHLKELFEKAKDVVPEHFAHNTPLFVLATAGMRLLPSIQRDRILKEVCDYAHSTTQFLLPDCAVHIRVIPGDVEGLYGWVATNYLLGGFDPSREKEHTTFGFLDMGGASAQIAFAPNATEAERHANDLTLMRFRAVGGGTLEYRVFSTTWLRFGVHEARVRYVEALEKNGETSKTKELLDPCLPPGLKVTPAGDIFLPDDKTVEGKVPLLIGIGKFHECLRRTQPLLEKDHVCEDEPCLVAGVHVPAIDFDVNHFVGVSEYWHTTHEIFQTGEKDKAYDFNTYQQQVSKFCEQDWSEIQGGIIKETWGGEIAEKTAVEICFKASWLINVLHEGIGIPRVGLEETPSMNDNGTSKLLEGAKSKGLIPAFRPINKIDDTEVSWTMGKILLYASSLVDPMQSDALPVGFGSNLPGVPEDFQYPSVQRVNPKTTTNNTTSTPMQPKLDGHTQQATTVLHTGSSRRVPGILLFLLILCFTIYFIFNRSRRKRLYVVGMNKSPSDRRFNRRNLFTGKLPGLFRSSPRLGNYERVDLEDGTPDTPDNFELGGYLDEEGSSDSNSGSRNAARSSGCSPTRNRVGKVHGEQGNAGFDGLGSGQGLGIGMPGNAIGRSGLIGRADGREQMGALVDGERQSRSGSPARRSTSR